MFSSHDNLHTRVLERMVHKDSEELSLIVLNKQNFELKKSIATRETRMSWIE
jgi:hypothetical protein